MSITLVQGRAFTVPVSETAGGSNLPLTLSAASVTSGATVYACSVTGQNITGTLPSNFPLGAATLAWTQNDGTGPVAESVPVSVVAASNAPGVGYIFDTITADIGVPNLTAADLTAQLVGINFGTVPPTRTNIPYPAGAPAPNYSEGKDAAGVSSGRYTCYLARALGNPLAEWVISYDAGGVVATQTVAASAAVSALTLYSASVDATGMTILMTFSGVATPPLVGTSGFAVTVNGSTAAVSSVTVGNASITLSMASAIQYAQSVVISYTPGNVTDSSTPALALASFTRTVINGSTAGQTSTAALLYASALGPQIVGVGTWRARLLRSLVDAATPIGYDAITGAPSTTLLPGVFTSDDLDDALRAALIPLSDYRPVLRQMPPLQLVAGQATYSLPIDFDEPEPRSWEPIAGLSSFESGRYPGSRFEWFRLMDTLSSPMTRDSSRSYGYGLGGGGYGYGFLGVGGVMDWGAGLVYDSNGDLAAGGNQRHGAYFFGPDLDHQTPYLLLTPTPTFVPPTPYTSLFYKATHRAYRLTVNGTNNGYATNTDGTIMKSLPPSYDALDPAVDVLSFTEHDTEFMLSLLYAKYYLLNEKVLASADRGDSQTYSFFQQSTGMARKDIEKQAELALSQFQIRTSKKPKGRRL